MRGYSIVYLTINICLGDRDLIAAGALMKMEESTYI